MDPRQLSDEAQDAFDRDLNDHLDRIIPADDEHEEEEFGNDSDVEDY